MQSLLGPWRQLWLEFRVWDAVFSQYNRDPCLDGLKWGKIHDMIVWDTSRQKDVLPWWVLWASRWWYWDKVLPGMREDQRELLTISGYRRLVWELYLLFLCNLLEHKWILLCEMLLPFSISTLLRNWSKRREKERKEKGKSFARRGKSLISILVWFSVPFVWTTFSRPFGVCRYHPWPFLSGLGHHVLISEFLLPANARGEHQM